MSGKILLLNTNRMRPRVAPIGLDYVAAALEHSGASVKLFDLALEDKGHRARLKKLLKTFSPDLIGITIRNIDDCYFLSGQFLVEPIRTLVSWLKKNSPAKIVLGGVGYSIAPSGLLDYLAADYGIFGDGEAAAIKLLNAVAADKEPLPSNIPGLVVPGAKDCRRAETDPARLFRNRKLADNARYFRLGGQLGIETKRGCDGRCIYCADPLAKGRKIRLRGAEAVADEIEELLSYGAWAFHLCDSEFNRPYAHATAVLEEIVRRGLGKKIALSGYLSPMPFDLELAKLYAQAGGKGICFGSDSGSDQMLSILKRDHTAQDLDTTLTACKKAGIKVMYDLLLGGPGETRKTLAETIRLMQKIKPDRVGVSYGLRVYAGTPLARLVAKEELMGAVEHNPELIFPVFYLAPALRKTGLEYLRNLIGRDSRFLLPAKTTKEQNYNYSGNLYLEKLITKGARGAYWHILLNAVKG